MTPETRKAGHTLARNTSAIFTNSTPIMLRKITPATAPVIYAIGTPFGPALQMEQRYAILLSAFITKEPEPWDNMALPTGGM